MQNYSRNTVCGKHETTESMEMMFNMLIIRTND